MPSMTVSHTIREVNHWRKSSHTKANTKVKAAQLHAPTTRADALFPYG